MKKILGALTTLFIIVAFFVIFFYIPKENNQNINQSLFCLQTYYTVIDDKRCYTLAEQFQHASAESNIPLMKQLIQKGANVNANKDPGYPPLYNAASSGNEESVRFLIANGADVNAKGKGKESSLYAAIHNGNLKIAIILIVNGASYIPPTY